MCIIRRAKKNTSFVQIDIDSLEDPNLSWKAKGLLSYLLSRPDNCDLRLSSLFEQSLDGQTATKSALKELEKAGYFKQECIREKGRIVRWKKMIYESPSLNPDWQSPKKNS